MSDQYPYCYPGTNVYRNKEDIRNLNELEEVERMLAATQLETLPRDEIDISPRGYRKIHHYLFKNIYEWAGQDRYVDTGRTGPFCLASYIEPEMNKLFAALNAEDNLRGLSIEHFADRAAEYVGELNAIHPFLDGNGRTLRAFLEILAERAGHEIDLALIDPKAWNHACAISFHKVDHGLLRDVIRFALVP